MLRINNAVAAEGANFHSPFNGDLKHTRQIPVTASGLTSAEVTPGGFLKPGVPFGATIAAFPAALAAGTPRTLITAASSIVEGVTINPQRIAKSNSSADLTAAGTIQVTVGMGEVSRKRIEEMLGRVLTANELAGFAPALAGAPVTLAR